MGENSEIEWCDSTFNPWEGCTKVGPGCDSCYAEARNARYGGGTAPNWGPGAPRRRTSASNWAKPLKWARDASRFGEEHGRRQRVFCASLADVFDNEVPIEWRYDLFKLIDETPELDWLLLTKRIGNVDRMIKDLFERFAPGRAPRWPDNVLLGATIVNQLEADRDIPKLLEVPACRRFLSIEPLLGPVNLNLGTVHHHPDNNQSNKHVQAIVQAARRHFGPCIDWIIVGGESGPNARPMHLDWVASLRDQCAEAGVPMLLKQWGEWVFESQLFGKPPANLFDRAGYSKPALTHHWPGDEGWVSFKVGKARAGRLLDGVTHDGFPADLP